MRERSLRDEMNEHIELAEQNKYASDNERDERLDAALYCAQLLLVESLSAPWTSLRAELEDVRGVPFIYARVGTTWTALPPLYAEVEGREGLGYALSALIPSAELIMNRLAASVARKSVISAAQLLDLTLLVVHAHAAPCVLHMRREEVLDHLINVARGEGDTQALDPWGAAVERVTYLRGPAWETHSSSITRR